MNLTAPSRPAPHCSQSIVPGGRDASEQVVAIVGMRNLEICRDLDAQVEADRWTKLDRALAVTVSRLIPH
jgi:hypothetical protein